MVRTVFEEALVLWRTISSLMPCSHRKVSAPVASKVNQCDNCDESCMSTDSGEQSTTDISDHSDGSDGSDTDSPRALSTNQEQDPVCSMERSRILDTSNRRCPTGTNDSHTGNASRNTLRKDLLELSQIDNARVLTVRNISRLGLNASSILQVYFSRFGAVEQVMASTTCSKDRAGDKPRVRPASCGFVVMRSAEDAGAALQDAQSHVVCGVRIGVFEFQSRSIAPCTEMS
jgi:hypothetical protein